MSPISGSVKVIRFAVMLLNLLAISDSHSLTVSVADAHGEHANNWLGQNRSDSSKLRYTQPT